MGAIEHNKVMVDIKTRWGIGGGAVGPIGHSEWISKILMANV